MTDLFFKNVDQQIGSELLFCSAWQTITQNLISHAFMIEFFWANCSVFSLTQTFHTAASKRIFFTSDCISGITFLVLSVKKNHIYIYELKTMRCGIAAKYTRTSKILIQAELKCSWSRYMYWKRFDNLPEVRRGDRKNFRNVAVAIFCRPSIQLHKSSTSSCIFIFIGPTLMHADITYACRKYI